MRIKPILVLRSRTFTRTIDCLMMIFILFCKSIFLFCSVTRGGGAVILINFWVTFAVNPTPHRTPKGKVSFRSSSLYCLYLSFCPNLLVSTSINKGAILSLKNKIEHLGPIVNNLKGSSEDWFFVTFLSWPIFIKRSNPEDRWGLCMHNQLLLGECNYHLCVFFTITAMLIWSVFKQKRLVLRRFNHAFFSLVRSM